MLEFGEALPIGDELPFTNVEIFDKGIAIAKSPEGRGLYVGQAKLVLNGPDRLWVWSGEPRFVRESEIVLHSESVSTKKSHPQVVWRKK